MVDDSSLGAFQESELLNLDKESGQHHQSEVIVDISPSQVSSSSEQRQSIRRAGTFRPEMMRKMSAEEQAFKMVAGNINRKVKESNNKVLKAALAGPL